MTDILGLHRTNSRASIRSITSFASSINTKKAYKEFCKSLHHIGVTEEMISQKKSEILNMFKSLNTSIEDQRQLLVVSDAESSPISTDRTISRANWKQSRFGWVRMDFLVGPRMLAAAAEGDTKRLISTLEFIRDIHFKDDQAETALHKAAYGGYNDVAELLLGKGASINSLNKYNNTPLHLAASNGHTSMVELLLMEGALIEPRFNSTFRNISTFTPLQLATRNGHTDTVKLLEKKNTELSAQGEDHALVV